MGIECGVKRSKGETGGTSELGEETRRSLFQAMSMVFRLSRFSPLQQKSQPKTMRMRSEQVCR